MLVESKHVLSVVFVLYTHSQYSLPVDGALFLEFIPGSHQWLLTLLSAWWSFGQLVASLISWGFISNYSCTADTTQPCPSNENQGWRYTLYVIMSSSLIYHVTKARPQLHIGFYDVLNVFSPLCAFYASRISKISSCKRPRPRGSRGS